MKSSTLSACNRSASTVDLKAATYVPNIIISQLAGAARPHRITGLVINDKQAGIGRVWLRKIRSEINHICKHPKTDVPDGSVERIMGLLAFVNSVDDARYSILVQYIINLKSRFPESGINLLPIS
ncbi:hypothetical protein ACFLVS_02420 [Chloroflexota bacterium]